MSRECSQKIVNLFERDWRSCRRTASIKHSLETCCQISAAWLSVCAKVLRSMSLEFETSRQNSAETWRLHSVDTVGSLLRQQGRKQTNGAFDRERADSAPM